MLGTRRVIKGRTIESNDAAFIETSVATAKREEAASIDQKMNVYFPLVIV